MKRALVLSGGGAKGAYQCGVWKYFKESNMKFDVVIGTSIGALNGVMIVQNRFDDCLKLWENINVDKVLNNGVNLEFNYELLMSQKERFLPLIKTATKKKSLDTAPLFELIKSNIDAKKIYKSKMDFFIVTVEVPNFMPYQINMKTVAPEKMADYLMASATVFPAFPLKHIDEKKYVDGGFYDNLPINSALEQKADEIIAVNLKAPGLVKKPRQHNKKVIIIEPYWNLGGLLNFDNQMAKRNITLGYHDACKIFGKYMGFAYTFLIQTELLSELAFKLKKEIDVINSGITNRLVNPIIWELNESDNRLLGNYPAKDAQIELVLRLLERLMELLDYSPVELYGITEIVNQITTKINEVEQMNIEAWLQRFIKKPEMVIKELEAKNLVFSLARDLQDIDSNIIAMFYKVFPSECLMGLLLKSLINEG